MKTKFFLIPLILLSLVLLLLSALRTPAQASFLDNIKDFLSIDDNSAKSKEFTLESQIELVPEGDENKDGKIDAGDTVIFKYIIKNSTSTPYQFVTLRTNINRINLNFIHNIKGTSSLSDQKSTIDIPNLFIKPNQDLEVSFEARVNYFDDADHTLFTQPELISSSKQKLFTSPQFGIKAKALPKGRIPSSVFRQIRKK